MTSRWASHQRKRFEEGIALFNRQQFFDCHEVLEEVWLQVSGDEKKFLQGLIQVAVAFHHLRHGNLRGARRLLAAGVDKLSGFGREEDSVDVAAILASLEPLQQQLNAGEVPPDWPSPRILLKDTPLPSKE
ncbi:MAG: DUF309 domain-containing protein [Acidobacteria bacterium]|nr:DUF309 domain-containing protein [Acidobacteriota bacterium]